MTAAPSPAPPVADVSVALCTHNGARFVAEQIESILRQVPRPREIVVGDDASTDATVAIVRAAVNESNRLLPESPVSLVVLERSQPLGVIRNFEETLRTCSSSLVALSDQDDLWPEGRLARLLPLFDDPSVSLVHTDARLVDARGSDMGAHLLSALEASDEELTALERGAGFPVLLRRNLVTGATVVLRKDLADRAMPFPPSWVHDEWLAMMAAVEGGLRLVREPWLDYRQHGGNAIGASEVTWGRRWERLREPRDERAPRLVARASALVERLMLTRPESRELADARAKLAHERHRASLPSWQLLRLPGVAAGVISGRYRRYNRGSIDILRDVVQPATRSRRRSTRP